MENTLKMFKSINNQKLYNYTLEELGSQYKLNHNPQILANVFIRNYGLIKSCGTKFFTLQDDDISSISVSTLDYCLLNFNINKDLKFTTYFYSVLIKNFKTEQKSRLYDKRKYNYLSKLNYFIDNENNDLDYSEDNLLSVINFKDLDLWVDYEQCYTINYSDTLLKITINESKLLTDKEKQYCNVIIDSNTVLSKTDLSEILNVSRPTLYSIIKSLKDNIKKILLD